MRLCRAYGCALDTNIYVYILEELRPEAMFSRHTWSRAWYYGDAFAHFAPDIVLEYHTRTGTINGLLRTSARRDGPWRFGTQTFMTIVLAW